MILFESKLLLTTTFILFVTSAKCCIYSSDLVELGLKLLKDIDEIEFTDYEAIKDFKRTVEFAVNTSIVATPELIKEAAIFTRVTENQRHIVRDTYIVRRNFDQVFSLLTPYNGYDANEVANVYRNLDISSLYGSSSGIFKVLFKKPQGIRKVIKRYGQLTHKFHCKSTISVHHKVVALHNRAILNLIMGFSTLIYLYKKPHFAPRKMRKNPEQASEIFQGIFNRLTNETYDTLNSLTENLPRDIDRCDPNEHVIETTYDRLYDLVEYYVTSERFLNGSNQCSATSEDYHGIKHSSEIENYIDSTIRCQGTLYQCSIVNLKHLFLYGEDDIYRRYHGFSVADPQSPDGEKVYGNIGDATVAYTSDDLNGVGEYSPNYPNFNLTSNELDRLQKCPIYGCYCDNHDSPRTVRYFSTKLVTSDVEQNRVITGLRLKVQDRVVYIQAQTGKLVGLGVVDPASVEWNEIEPVNVTGVDEKSPEAEFIKLDYNARSLYLDDLKIDDGYYLTGVQFARANGGVSIAAQFTLYYDRNLVTFSPFQRQESKDFGRTERKLDHRETLLDMVNLDGNPISVQNQDFIKFQPSDIENDAGQTTVPFLDIQAVVTDPPTALSGFGIHLKGGSGPGTFVALKLFSAKFKHELMVNLSPESDIEMTDSDMKNSDY